MGIYFASICGIIGKGKAVWITDRRGKLKRDGTRAETRLRLSAKRTNPFKSAGASVQSTTGTAEVCASVEVMLDTPCSDVVWRVLATHYIRQFPLHFPFRASPCAITFQLESNKQFVSENFEKENNNRNNNNNNNNNNNKVLQCEAWSLSGGDHRWFKRSTGKKRPVTGDTNNNNNNMGLFQSHSENTWATYRENMKWRNYRKQPYWALHTHTAESTDVKVQ